MERQTIAPLALHAAAKLDQDHAAIQAYFRRFHAPKTARQVRP
jgi:hypothetical protein